VGGLCIDFGGGGGLVLCVLSGGVCVWEGLFLYGRSDSYYPHGRTPKNCPTSTRLRFLTALPSLGRQSFPMHRKGPWITNSPLSAYRHTRTCINACKHLFICRVILHHVHTLWNILIQHYDEIFTCISIYLHTIICTYFTLPITWSPHTASCTMQKNNNPPHTIALQFYMYCHLHRRVFVCPPFFFFFLKSWEGLSRELHCSHYWLIIWIPTPPPFLCRIPTASLCRTLAFLSQFLKYNPSLRIGAQLVNHSLPPPLLLLPPPSGFCDAGNHVIVIVMMAVMVVVMVMAMVVVSGGGGGNGLIDRSILSLPSPLLPLSPLSFFLASCCHHLPSQRSLSPLSPTTSFPPFSSSSLPSSLLPLPLFLSFLPFSHSFLPFPPSLSPSFLPSLLSYLPSFPFLP
jgi:hypothetical protein